MLNAQKPLKTLSTFAMHQLLSFIKPACRTIRGGINFSKCETKVSQYASVNNKTQLCRTSVKKTNFYEK